MMLRFVAVLVTGLLLAGEGLCTTVCAPEPTTASEARAGTLPPCHQTGDAAPEPEAPPTAHECGGPCAASLTAGSPELPGQTCQAPPAIHLACAAPAPDPQALQPTRAAERLPPPPARFLLHASFLI